MTADSTSDAALPNESAETIRSEEAAPIEGEESEPSEHAAPIEGEESGPSEHAVSIEGEESGPSEHAVSIGQEELPFTSPSTIEPPATGTPSGSIAYELPFLRTMARWILVAIALYASGWLLWNAGPALRPFIVGLVLAYFLLPLVNVLARRIPRALAILVVYLVGIGLLIGMFDYIVPLTIDQIQQLIENTPSIGRIQEMTNDLLRQYRNRVPVMIRQPIEEGMLNAVQMLQANITTYLQGVGT